MNSELMKRNLKKNIDKKEDIILVTYMEYHKKNNIELCGMPLGNKEIEFTPKKNNILIRIALGKFFVDNKTCNLIIDNSINNLTDFILNSNDMYDLIKDSENKTDENIDTKKIYLINKNGVFVYFKRTQNAFKIVKVVIKVKINPEITKGIQTPINIITELNNNKNGNEKIVKNKIINKMVKVELT